MKYLIPKYTDGSTPTITYKKNMTTITFTKNGTFKLVTNTSKSDDNKYLINFIAVGAGSDGYSGGQTIVNAIRIDNQELFNVTIGSEAGDSSIINDNNTKIIVAKGGSKENQFKPLVINGATYSGHGGQGGKYLDFTPLGNGIGSSGKHISLGGKHIYSSLGTHGTGAGASGGNGSYKYTDLNGDIQYIEGKPGEDAEPNTGGAGGMGGAISDTQFAPSGKGGSGIVILSFPTDKMIILISEPTNNIPLALLKKDSLQQPIVDPLQQTIVDPLQQTIVDPLQQTIVDPLQQTIVDPLQQPIVNYYPISNNCFPSGTPITLDQGIISIDKINPLIHTIMNIPIVGISKTFSTEKQLVCFEPNALGYMYPNSQTIMSMDHKILYKDKMIYAKHFVGHFLDKVKMIEYDGNLLYNVLLPNYATMNVNGLVVETLHPKNPIAKLFLHHSHENSISI